MQKTFQWFIFDQTTHFWLDIALDSPVWSPESPVWTDQNGPISGPSTDFYVYKKSKRMTAPAKPKQMSRFGLELKFSPGLHRLLKLKNIRKRPEQKF